MASALALVLTVVALAVNTLVVAVLSRFFRIRLKTQWGWVTYTVLVSPVVLVVLGLVEGVVIRSPLFEGAAGLFLAVFVGVPLALGFTIDLLYVPPPEEYDLPATE
ncbi:hypothetical protein [Halobaculum gomorrense]|uniref:DUF7991 domain-containing protein n=1 Tax=Halobaculum gomorrense TaxID=43928 RepID=A0A1M5MHM9_9EURY|nr:hypothetical protein [Halobaculum gomorrense]SHG76830.1 hypothetical protein SAMN05443636_1018 [Halobaculum gomorrense]